MDQKGCWEMQLCVGTGLLTEDCDNDDEIAHSIAGTIVVIENNVKHAMGWHDVR